MPAVPAIRGLNHLTLAVTDVERSVAFYRDLLGCRLRAIWADGAYLEAGPLWLCLSRDPAAVDAARGDYTHYAFDVDPAGFDTLCAAIRAQAVIWKENRSEGGSLYFLDPDGHRLEVHIGTLASRLAHYPCAAERDATVLE
ncbi:catechol 2,3-dioxygenase-like lactoylglutathione lyase family enzyme [Sphingomonas zeicaulis]|uniref:VOC family protein n=1 Tax=Sphingomonas zeicaulis TaxID=1632740 RepID=UPI003D1F93EA